MEKGAYLQPFSNSGTIWSLGVYRERRKELIVYPSAFILWGFLWTLCKYFSFGHHSHKHFTEFVAHMLNAVLDKVILCLGLSSRSASYIETRKGCAPGMYWMSNIGETITVSVTMTTSRLPTGFQCLMLLYMTSINTQDNAMRCNIPILQKSQLMCGKDS